MGNDLLKLASSQGIWAALSFALIFYIIKTQEKRDLVQAEREQKYQEIINTLTNEFNIIKSIQADVLDIKGRIDK